MDCWWAGAAYVGTRVGRATRAGLWLSAAASIALCASCKYGEVVVVQPAAAGHGPLALSIQVDPEDSAVARELGWTRGIPGAEVTVSSGDADTATGPPIAVLQADSAGSVSVADLPDGSYLVEVRRLLSSSESGRLAVGEDVVGFMAKTLVSRGSDTLLTPASRRHSIVISEWAFRPLWTGTTWYEFGGFLELANNSDTTVFLDGLVIGEAYALAWDFRPGACAASEATTNDPDGVWTRYFDSLPGRGQDHPLAPGAVAVIATDAIDHSRIAPGGLDLSHADFDFVGAADVVNPDVPNTVSIGLEPYRDGHGLYLNATLQEVTFVALPVNVAALPMTPLHDYVRIPRARILDVMAQVSTFQFPGGPLCPHLVNATFDRYPGRFGAIGGGSILTEAREGLYSVQRKVAYTRSDGRKILQHTRTTSADFYLGLRTPGSLP
jgi:hypothetical protein